ncbi:ABC transporter substrate-binding protein [Promicromonospora thailandica]|uniref:NitT/TauT family transport system substrate-binding protein n=1 Tax=Promicromonospora thailandica TaxID=765201 RepID=A0A9X2G4V4_9MICO|nr:ABC transporter substrate-binding protein [Promicromonospora thailandica]MCP2266834.1 NitT/TauT family transport system substrate-binding protein [Promicromonospora thailandica]
MRRKIPLIATAVAAVLALASCATESGAAPESSSSATGPLQAVTVGVIPIVDVAPIYLGVQEGIFERQGLDVTLQLADGGAAIVPAVAKGEYQFGFSNVTSLLLASSKGETLKAVAPGNFSTGKDGGDFSAVVAAGASDIKTAADLGGRTVAVNSLNNIGDTTVRNVVDESGGDPSAVEFVEMPFPEMLPALAAGEIDAAWVVEPFLTTAVQQGAKIISSNFAQTDHDLLVAAYFTSDQTIQQSPETVAAFTEAIKEALTYAQDHPDETRAVLDTYTEIDPVVKSVMVMPRFAADIEPTYLQVLADLGLKYGLFDKPVDVNKLLVQEAPAP